jgi:hypothetical protein
MSNAPANIRPPVHPSRRSKALCGLLLLAALSLPVSPLHLLAAETVPLRLIACPDCDHEVSRRAISCPHCGCPGAAISEAVRAAENAARPLPLVRIKTEDGDGVAAVIAQTGSLYAVFDGALIFAAQSLALAPLTKDQPVTYNQLEVAADSALVRVRIQSDAVTSLPLGNPHSGEPVSWLTADGLTQPTAPSAASLRTIALLDSDNRVVAIVLASAPKAAPIPISSDTVWMPVAPGDYRTQTALLRRIAHRSPATALTPADREALRATVWLTPFLKKSADALLTTSPTL